MHDGGAETGQPAPHYWLAALVSKGHDHGSKCQGTLEHWDSVDSVAVRDPGAKSRYRSASQPSLEDNEAIQRRQLVEKIRLEKVEARKRRQDEETRLRRAVQQERAEKRKERQKMFNEAVRTVRKISFVMRECLLKNMLL